MTKALWDDPEPAARIAARSALKRWGEIEEVAEAAVFLCSTSAAYVTGTVLPVVGVKLDEAGVSSAVSESLAAGTTGCRHLQPQMAIA